MKPPVEIDYDSIENHTAEQVVFVIGEQTLPIPHGLIIEHDREKKIIKVPESFALRQGLI